MTDSIQILASRWVNAYLVKAVDGFVLIDTGLRFTRRQLDHVLADAGCGPGDLKLIVITHGDADHSGNAAYLRDKYRSRIATHRAEAASVDKGDMFLSRGPVSPSRRVFKATMFLFRLRKRDRFAPDLYLRDGDRLAEYGLDATVLHLPGHSKGSIAVLMDDGAFFCGDFLENRDRPSAANLVDDAEALSASLDRAKTLDIRIVYPGHGEPFGPDEVF